jgi:transcriptional regulator with XRE-family HTH domain
MRARVIAAVEALIARYPGKTLRQIAEVVGIEQPVLSAMRHGRSIGLLSLLKLRDATGQSLDVLLFGTEGSGRKAGEGPASPEAILAGIEASMAELRSQIASSAETAPKKPSDPPRPRRR